MRILVIKNKVAKSGYIEFVYLIATAFIGRTFSLIKIFLLRLRSYEINYTVNLGKNSFIFQSEKSSVKIDKYSTIGAGVRIKAGFKGKIIIGERVLIDDYSILSAHESIRIGSNTMVSANCYLVDFNHKVPLSLKDISKKEGYKNLPITVGSNVWLGTHVIVLPGVKIGEGAVVGAGSVVTKDVPPFVIVAGNPARIVKKIKKI